MAHEKDKHGNHVKTTQFESFLSKLIIENKRFYVPVYLKITHSIKNLMTHNASNKKFNEAFSFYFDDLNISYPGNNNIDDLLKEDFDFAAANGFFKKFFENVFEYAVKIPLERKNKFLSLSELAQLKVCSSPTFFKRLATAVRPDSLFSEANRGRIELYPEEMPQTKNLGIIDEEHIPQELCNYFKHPHKPALLQFKRDPKAEIVKKMSSKDLPYVSGASGTLGYCFKGMIQLDTYTAAELKLFFMALTAHCVSKGHHSFYEVQVVAETLGFNIDDNKARREFYEQFLATEFINSPEYKTFITSEPIATYFEEYKDNKSLSL